jgi:hypothetical protein
MARQIGMMLSLFFIHIWLANACSPKIRINDDAGIPIHHPSQANLTAHLGKRITVVGKTANAKLGAVLLLENEQKIWMDEMGSWPDAYHPVKVNIPESKILRVTGILVEKSDLPVFTPSNDGASIPQGMPTPSTTDLAKARQRFLLKNYRWVVVE